MSGARIVRILPSVSLAISGGGTVSLDELQAFVDQAKAMGVPVDKRLATHLKAPYHYDQRDHDPGGFTITAEP